MYSIRETFVFQTEIYTFRIFICSSCCFFFLSSPWGSVCCFFSTRSTRTCRCHGKWSFFGSSFFLVVKNPYVLRSQIRFWVLPEKRTLTVGFKVWTANGCWPFPRNYFELAPNLCQFQRPRCWESISPENSRSKIRLPCRLIDSTSRKLLLLVHKIGYDAMELKSVIFDFFFINTVLKMQILRCSRRLTHRLDQQHQAPFLTPFPAE